MSNASRLLVCMILAVLTGQYVCLSMKKDGENITFPRFIEKCICGVKSVLEYFGLKSVLNTPTVYW